MVEYSGSTVFGNGEIVTGRICYANDVGTETVGCASIVLWNGVERISEGVMRSAVGLVAPSEYAWRACAIALPYSVPVMCVNASPDGTFDLRGSVAILDTVKQRLYVDPDVDRISALLEKDKAREHTRIPRLAVIGESGDIGGFDGAVTECGGKDADGEYKRLCELADTNTGVRIVAEVRFDGGTADFCRHVTNVFRAGVWGRFSLLCKDVYTPTRRRECALAIHSVFRELDVSGREFNGFIPKGIVIDTPALLLDSDGARELDLYCIDVDSLINRFCGLTGDGEYNERIYRYVEDFCLRAERARIALRLRRGAHTELCERLCEHAGGLEIYQNAKNTLKIFKKSEKSY